MSRYQCYKCKTEHGTDNVVACCAFCVDELKCEIAARGETINRQAEEINRIEGEFDTYVKGDVWHHGFDCDNTIAALREEIELLKERIINDEQEAAKKLKKTALMPPVHKCGI